MMLNHGFSDMTLSASVILAVWTVLGADTLLQVLVVRNGCRPDDDGRRALRRELRVLVFRAALSGAVLTAVLLAAVSLLRMLGIEL